MKLTKASGIFGFMALATLGSPMVSAEDNGWYLGGSLGQARADIDNAEISSELLEPGVIARTLDEDNRDTGFKVFAGYQFNPYFSLEGGYFDLGEFEFNAATVPPGTLDGSTSVGGINLDVVGYLPFNKKLSAFARLGANYAEVESVFTGTDAATNANFSTSERNVNPKFGLGLQYAFNERLALRIEAERYRIKDAIDNNGDVDFLSAGLVYRFGHKAKPVAVAEPIRQAPVVPPEPKVESYTLSATELFAFNRSELREPQEKLQEISKAINASGEPREVLILGYTDNIGSEQYNQKLSERRAQAVKDYLVKQGVSAERLRIEGRGEADPVVFCSDKKRADLIKCLQPNRRAQIDQIIIKREIAQ